MKDYQLIFNDGRFLTDAGGADDPPNPSFIEIAQFGGGAAGIGIGSVVGRIFIQCTEDYNNLTSAQFSLRFANAGSDTADTLGSQPDTTFFSETVNRAQLVAGRVLANIVIPPLPISLGTSTVPGATHIRLNVDLSGTTPTQGSFFAGYSLESEGLRGQRPGQQLRGARGPWQSQYTAGFNPNTPARTG